MSQPLTPRRAAAAIEKGDDEVEVILQVDPPTVSGSTVKGGDAGMSKLIAAMNKRENRQLSLAIADNMRAHHIDILSTADFGSPLSLSLEIRNNNVISYNPAGYPAKWKNLLENKSIEIHSLDISGNSMEDSPPPKCFLEPISTCSTLQSLTMRHLRTTIESSDVREEFDDWLGGVVKNQSLTSLDLTHNELNEVSNVINDVSVNVKKLYLSWNDLTGSAISSISQQVASQLTVLHFGRNQLTETDGQLLASALTKMPNLKELELNDNDLKTACSLVFKNITPGIEYLGLHGNMFGDDCVNGNGIKNAIKKLTNLTTLDISSNNLTKKGLANMNYPLEYLHSEHKLTKLIASNNSFGCNRHVLQMHLSGLKVDVFKAVTKELFDVIKQPVPEGGWSSVVYPPVIVNEVMYSSKLEAPIVLSKGTTVESFLKTAADLVQDGRKSPLAVTAEYKAIVTLGIIMTQGKGIIIKSIKTGIDERGLEFMDASFKIDN
eukprot:TRINITY_DN10643_c1_g1_i1.p1 TRINITY_DN10643_c1_g1~~TRINITY_DN10643_c1_g1_i1.p1  ORF type:complete len:492 (+),score=100.77 TRINITY_DN10643_c1_g1_i1:65-1540(+)